MSSTFGDKLKAIRDERQWTQEALATVLGTSKQVVSRYEKGQREPKITIVSEYAKKLNVPLVYLLDNNCTSLELAYEMQKNKNDTTNKDDLEFFNKYQLLDHTDKETIKNLVNLTLTAAKYQM